MLLVVADIWGFDLALPRIRLYLKFSCQNLSSVYFLGTVVGVLRIRFINASFSMAIRLDSAF